MTIQVKKPRSIGWRIPVNGKTHTPYIKSGGHYRQTCLAYNNNPRIDQEFIRIYEEV